MAQCEVCFRQCHLNEGQMGPCHARIGRQGKVVPAWYGELSSMALDPVEKKPLRHFYPGRQILSVGSLGCNLDCPFCQNHVIAKPADTSRFSCNTEHMDPEKLTKVALSLRDRGNIGVAFTYNEPLVGYEYVRDCAREVQKNGMVNVLVTNGTASLQVLEEIAPYISAMNIDLKGFTDAYYSGVLGGSRQMVMDFISEAVRICHVELTTLIVPGYNDSQEEMEALTEWVSGHPQLYGGGKGRDIPLHVTRFFPRHRFAAMNPTATETVYRLADVARQRLRYVYTGNC
ncbi:MAG: AmmeMemoRadiSam system radical SAM enzyme [Clostridia bacterium]|nr:AmmeMemoRadiSam system radical SAM enzyme [Clostridia bacterium]